MSLSLIALVLIALGTLAYIAGRARALASAGGNSRVLHSLPRYYGVHAAMLALVPAFGLMALWLILQPVVLSQTVSGMLSDDESGLVLSDVRRVADGLDLAVSRGVIDEADAQALTADGTIRDLLAQVGAPLASAVNPEVLNAAQAWRAWQSRGNGLMAVAVLIVALAGLGLAWMRTDKEMRARNRVEQGVRLLLIAAASIAILTTVGIVLSLIFTTVEFFRIYPASEFFFGTTWSPSFGGGSELGVLPLLWGTLYISVIALLVAVPIGLFSAIYLSEYASAKVRGIIKPLLEVLAGIPTIVYGLFALLTVGPLLLEVFGRDGLGWMQAGTAVMTAGLVMGIMLIPFVSSLSDDIMGGVPQALRDGSYGLGATRSETIRQVVLPAALPGIVGAVLLAASRAIGETMIVVLGAGAAAKLGLNPFDAMTTVTAKIVSQLTGDADFSSPEALVAFALGMTLFVITLGLNVVALWIVRRYREQYE
ncbi:phosphate ABC transporter permease subunit PstC [Roseovarius aquimarinus]